MPSYLRYLLILAAILSGDAAPSRGDDAEIRKLIDAVATGQDSGQDAADKLIEMLAAPIADAFGAMESRSVEQQLRLRPVLRRLQAQIRIRLFRANLAQPQRRLLDAFAGDHRELLEQLFDENEYVRLEALHRIPLEPGTAAGILIVARVDDWNETVAEQALEVAREFHDEHVLSGLTRYVADVVGTLRSGVYGANDQDVARTVGTWAQQAIGILGQAKHRAALPVITDAIEFFDQWRYRDPSLLAECFDALGALGDEQSAPLLVRFLEQRDRRFSRSAAGERTIVQTLGDAALLNLLRIYKLPPEPVGFVSDTERSGQFGFCDERTRAAAQQAFSRWYEANRAKPADQRSPLVVPPGAASAPSAERR
ncbi:hypothetical protein RAS1_23830 [Phycisphaerae bacterium RAS1]|nr:hypothetical protein RAS1_23830 [Phycisphaerae bacterium RAS1]